MKKILIILMTTMSLAACSSSSKTTLCTSEFDTISSTVELKHKGDNVKSQTAIQEMSIEDAGISEEEVTSIFEEIATEFADLKGVTYSYIVKDGIISNTLVIDYTKADLNELFDLGLVQSQNDKAPESISLEATQSGLESSGFTCKLK